ncbi:hypothetical protein F511_12835 [Dorcoceras hygrometricum]|uniref:Uncharacterized protein n=1 Tax=Dorcoceras hygrometricum TaxID=472368 RepID=A0A2Z7CEV4_9LAMI|nr:hypothetical protein F511_12835 [Dorcoceras hygrometricum]
MMRGLAAPIAAPPAASVRPSRRTGCAPPCNDCAWPLAMSGHHARPAAAAVDPPIRSTTGINLPPSICTRRLDGFYHGRNLLSTTIGASPITGLRRVVARAALRGGIQLAVGPQPLWLRNHNFGLAQWIMVKRLATSAHDPLGITDSACKNQLVMVRVQYGPFNTYIPIRSTTIDKSRVARDPIAMHTSWRSNSDIASVTSKGYPRMRASGESSTTKHRLLHASGPHPIPPPNDPNYQQAATVHPDESFGVIFNQSRMHSRRELQRYMLNQSQALCIQSQALCIQSQDDVPVVSYSGSSRELQRFVYLVDMESNRKKADVVESYNLDARYPVAVFEASAVAQRIQRNQRSRWKNQWLRLSRAYFLELREQDLYYSGK